MLKLVLVGHDQGRLKSIKRELEVVRQSTAELRIFTCRPEFMETQIDSKLKVLVFDTRSINKNLFPFVEQIRKMEYSGPIVLLGNAASDFDVRELTELNQVFHLGKPYDVDQLSGLIKNCINVDKLRSRRDQRFSVREQATLEAYSSDFKTKTLINDISRSGVRIEGDLGDLKKGDLLRLHFNFDKINKERTMSARVVWMKTGSDIMQAGLEFVSPKVVYQYLLDDAVA